MNSTRTSRAAVLVERGKPLDIRAVPIPSELERGAILVRNTVATVCGSDVHVWEGAAGADRALPLVLGHEMVGEIAELGPDATTDSIGQELTVGDRITWSHGQCGQCYFCVVEREPTLCTNWRGYMVGDPAIYPNLVGGFSEYTYVYPTSGRIRLPDDVPDALAAASSCSLRTVIAAFERLGTIREHHTVVIQGAGPVGLFAAAKAVSAGAARVFVIGGPQARLDLATAWGAVPVPLTTSPADRLAAVHEATGGRGADIVVEASGAPQAWNEGINLLRRGGRYLIIGQAHDESVSFNPSVLLAKHLTVIGSLSAHIRHYHRALEFIRHNAERFDWNLMLSNTYPLTDIMTAMERMQTWDEIKPVIDLRS
ncbi:L-iditol 2-dehydrogenase [Rhodococcus sp. 27YEA15]|uniref:zinc-binding dehydrogenase n=1 Tax=Rhodococcus sp. 27YEA15 TaxID=3156259 RepID=UPI003C79BC3B